MHCLLLAVTLLSTAQAEVRKVLDEYVKAWRAGDSARVMRTLTADSILVPGEKPPYIGAEAIRNYWWPANTPPFTPDRFTTSVDRIDVDGGLAVARGTQIIEWTSGRERWRTHGNYVTVLRRTSAGWKIAMQVAANSPNERIP